MHNDDKQKSMKYALVVLAAPGSGPGNVRAQKFARALSKANIVLTRVFFYGEGVRAASAENADSIHEWSEIAATQDCDLVLCSASAETHGVLTLPTSFTLMGLGALMEAGHDCDRVISFD